MKYILHVDMNAFFASVEEALNPKLRGKPIAVCGKTTRSVIAAANYEARKYGVKAAMPVFMGKRNCPQLILVMHNFEAYEDYSHKFISLIREKITNKVEIMSIDECLVDITHLCKNHYDAINIARKIQALIMRNLKLPCSIGVSYNCFLAKMASDIKKPMGITPIFTHHDIVKILWPLKVGDMYLIGPKSAAALNAKGIYTIGDLAKKENNKILESVLDCNWFIHYLHANGIGDDELDYSHNIPKSVSNSETMLTNSSDSKVIKPLLRELVREVVRRLAEYELEGRTISVWVKYPDFSVVSKRITSKQFYHKYEDIVHLAINLYEDNFLEQEIRLIGIGVSNVRVIEQLDGQLFDDYKPKKVAQNKDLNQIIESINAKMKLDILHIAKKKL